MLNLPIAHQSFDAISCPDLHFCSSLLYASFLSILLLPVLSLDYGCKIRYQLVIIISRRLRVNYLAIYEAVLK